MTEDGPSQLGLDGSETPHEQVVKVTRPKPSLNGAQRAILRVIESEGTIRPVEAGVVVHAHRSQPCRLAGAAGADRYKGGGKACCAYASSDGVEALKRLRARGLVERKGKGQYGAVSRA
jgi:hypothetical protein